MTVNLKYHGIGRFSEPAFSIVDNPLELDFEGIKGLSGEFIFVYRINDRPQKKLTLKGYKTAISLNELTAGQLDGKIIHCVRGVKVSEYDIEPLVLKYARNVIGYGKHDSGTDRDGSETGGENNNTRKNFDRRT